MFVRSFVQLFNLIRDFHEWFAKLWCVFCSLFESLWSLIYIYPTHWLVHAKRIRYWQPKIITYFSFRFSLKLMIILYINLGYTRLPSAVDCTVPGVLSSRDFHCGVSPSWSSPSQVLHTLTFHWDWYIISTATRLLSLVSYWSIKAYPETLGVGKLTSSIWPQHCWLDHTKSKQVFDFVVKTSIWLCGP